MGTYNTAKHIYSPAEKQRMELMNVREKYARQKMNNLDLSADNDRLRRENARLLKAYADMSADLFKARRAGVNGGQ